MLAGIRMGYGTARVNHHTGTAPTVAETFSLTREACVDLSKMRTPDWILGGCALVLIIDLIAFPWHKIDLGLGGLLPGVSTSVKRTAIQSPNSFWGVLALLLAIALVAVVVLRRLTTTKLPDLPISWSDATFYGAIAVLALLLLKLIIETSSLGWGCWLAIVLAGGAVYGAFAAKQADGQTSSTPPTSF